MILNPQAAGADIEEAPKQVELWLSDDGVTWTEATSGELSPLPIDQSFVLPAPVMARYAQLRITSMWMDDATTVALGEFKVIATPGTAPSSTPLNVADPALGGHMVFMDPQSPLEDTPYTALDEDLTPELDRRQGKGAAELGPRLPGRPGRPTGEPRVGRSRGIRPHRTRQGRPDRDEPGQPVRAVAGPGNLAAQARRRRHGAAVHVQRTDLGALRALHRRRPEAGTEP